MAFEISDHLSMKLPGYPDPADIVRITEALEVVDEWAKLTDAELSKKVNIGIPQQRDMDLPDGVYTAPSRYAKYGKTENGIIIVQFIIEARQGFPIDVTSVISILPVGFRPQYHAFLACCQSYEDLFRRTHSCPSYVRPNGEVVISPTVATDNFYFGGGAFFSAL